MFIESYIPKRRHLRVWIHKLNTRTAEIRSSIAPDHKAIYLSVGINDAFHRGPGTSKFNNQLLEDENYVQLITECLPRILAKYQEVESHQLLWELIKMEFRAETIIYSKAKRRELKYRETYLQEKLDALDNEICHGNDHLNQLLLDEYESIKTELKDIYEKKGKEAMFRSKARWIEKGEKPINYFFNLEKTKLWGKGYCTVKTWEWRNYFRLETNQPRNRIILQRFTRNKIIRLSLYEFQRELFRLCWEPLHSQIVLWRINVSWIRSDTWWDKKRFEILSEQQIPWRGWLFQRILWIILWPNWYTSPEFL